MLRPYAWLAVGALVLSLFGGTYYKGYASGKAHVQANWDADKNARNIAEEKAIADRIRENEAKTAKAEADKQTIKKGYADEIAKIRANNVVPIRLRIQSNSCGSTASSETKSSSGSNADATSTGVLSDSTTANLLALVQQADEIIAGCRAAQDFIKSQGMDP